MKFEELNVSDEVINGIHKTNLNEASGLQQSVISRIIADESLLIEAEPGTDKNAAIAIAALEKLARAENLDDIRVLIITADAETARQINEQIVSIGSSKESSICVDDDGNKDEQASAISNHVPIIVANPNRLQDLLQEHRFIFRHLDLVVLDEIDEMANNDTAGALKQIKRRILSDYTSLIFSQTLDKSINKVSAYFADEPTVAGFETAADSPPPAIRGDLIQRYIKVPSRMKISTLMAHIEQAPDENCVVFTASKRGTDRLYRVLKKRGLKATSLHHKLSDEKRAQRFANFTNSDVQYLLVSDISAAELDLNGINQVINYDVPNNPDEYRFRAALVSDGKAAQLVSLVSKQDQNDISQLQNELGQTPQEIPLPDEVKEKLKQRKDKKKQTGSGRNKKKQSRSSNSGNKKSRSQQKKNEEMQLPQPSYDKLSGGRSGNYDEKETGIVKFFKKLFS